MENNNYENKEEILDEKNFKEKLFTDDSFNKQFINKYEPFIKIFNSIAHLKKLKDKNKNLKNSYNNVIIK